MQEHHIISARRTAMCADCGQRREVHAYNLCKSCYNRGRRNQDNRPKITCVDCGKERFHASRGLCGSCYNRHHYQESGEVRERAKRRSAQYIAAHREQVRALHQRWLAANTERDREHHRRWKGANVEKVRAAAQRRYATDKDRLQQLSRAWKLANPEKLRVYRQRRKAKERALPATLTVEQWRAVLAAYKHKCAYCGRGDVKLTQDHVVPVAKGGGYVVQNIVPACLSCNSKKCISEPPKPVQTLLL